MAPRVLAVAQAAEPGGAELALLRLLGPLRERGLALEVAVPAAGAVADAARADGFEVHRLPFGSLRRGAWPRAVLAWPRAHAVVRRSAAEVVWLNGIVPQRLVPGFGGTPCLVWLHDLVERPRPWRVERFWRSVRAVACASEAVARAAAAAGAPSERLRVLPPPVEPGEPAPRPEWADGRPTVGFVGRVEPRKGLDDLLRALDQLGARIPDVRLVIVRGPALEQGGDEARSVIARAHGDERVTVLGPVADARALMPWFDVLCVPSRVEPFGTVAAEALAAGTPAVVTDSGGMPEYVVPGQNGDVVPPGDPAALAAALARVLPRAQAMRDAARDSAAPFATERVAAQLAGLLREAAGA
jgi:glycosyltransferase involved in cell wall biosynthesis